MLCEGFGKYCLKEFIKVLSFFITLFVDNLALTSNFIDIK